MFAILSPLKICLLLGASASILVGGGTMSSSSKQEAEFEIKDQEIKQEQKEETKASEAEAALLVIDKPAALSDPIEIKELGNKISELITKETSATQDIKDAIVLITNTEKEIINLTVEINDLQIKINAHKQQEDQAENAHTSSLDKQTIEKGLLDGLSSSWETKKAYTQVKTEENKTAQTAWETANNALKTHTLKISELEKALNGITQTLTKTKEKEQAETIELTSLNEDKANLEIQLEKEIVSLQASIDSAQHAVDNYSQPIPPSAVDDTTQPDLASKLRNSQQALSIKKTENQQLINDATDAVNQQQSKLTIITNKISPLKQEQQDKQSTLHAETAKLPALKDTENNADQELFKKESCFMLSSIEESEAKDLKDAQQKISDAQDLDVASKKKAFNELKNSKEAANNRAYFSDKTQETVVKNKLIATKNQTITTQEQMLKNFSSKKSELINQQERQELSELE